MNDADMIHRDRWIVCLHEAGHAVACSLLLGYGASAAVWLVRGEFGRCMVMGACGTRVGDRVWNVDEAVVVACGPAAERLAWNHAPPPDPLDPDPDIPPGGLETAISESTPPPPGVNEAHGMAPDDDGLLWAWATRRTPPRRWRLARKRLTTARALARALVVGHESVIVDVATAIYQKGSARVGSPEDSTISSRPPEQPQKGTDT